MKHHMITVSDVAGLALLANRAADSPDSRPAVDDGPEVDA